MRSRPRCWPDLQPGAPPAKLVPTEQGRAAIALIGCARGPLAKTLASSRWPTPSSVASAALATAGAGIRGVSSRWGAFQDMGTKQPFEKAGRHGGTVLRRAARQAAPGCRLPLRRRLPYAEIAQILGGTSEAARRAAADGIKNLRKSYPGGVPS